MPIAEEYEARIKALDWEGLRALWLRIEVKDTPDWAPGKAMEYLVLRVFELDGAEVRWPYSVEVEGEVAEQIDGAIHVGGLSCLVETKDRADPIDIVPIAKMRNQLMRRPSGTIGLVFSRSGFTLPAVTLTKYISPQTILLWYPGISGSRCGGSRFAGFSSRNTGIVSRRASPIGRPIPALPRSR